MHLLVTVGSRHGSTREIGAEIAQVLGQAGHAVEILDPDDVTSLDGFDAVVLGSAVYVGRLAESVRALAQRLEWSLAELPLWFFWTGPIGNPPRPAEEPEEVGHVATRLRANGVHMFAGRLEQSELGMAERALVATVGAAPGDYRDWDDIDRWAESIAEELRLLARRKAGPGRPGAGGAR